MLLFIILLAIDILLLLSSILGWFIGGKEMKTPFIVLSVGSLIAVVVCSICLYNIETYTVNTENYLVSFKAAKQRVGNYSEMEVYMCTDANGNASTCTRTNYWTESCSEVYYTKMLSHELIYKSEPSMNLVTDGLGFVYPQDPQQEWEISKYDLDSITVRREISYTLMLKIEGSWHSDGLNRKRYLAVIKDKKAGGYMKVEKLGSWVITNKTVQKTAQQSEDKWDDTKSVGVY